MQCWTWADVVCYFLIASVTLVWYLPFLGVILALPRFLVFAFIELPFGVLREFKITSFERRYPERPYSSFFEYAAIRYVAWILHTFRASTLGPVFFGEVPARFLYQLRRTKYGTENIGDFEYFSAEPYESFRGYWVRSRSRLNSEPDLVIYFVPGNLAGMSSSYVYLEYLSMLLVELQVQGFANPAALVADIHFHDPGGYIEAFRQTYDGWRHLTACHPNAVTLMKGSGVGGTLLLTLQLHLARPFAALSSAPVSDSPRHTVPLATSDVAQKLVNVPDQGVRSLCPTVKSECHGAIRAADDQKLSTADDLDIKSEGTGYETQAILNPPLDFKPRKPDAMLLISPFPAIWVDRFGNEEDLICAKVMVELRKRLITPEQAFETWARPGNVRDNSWWAEALPSRGSVVMYGTAELLSHDVRQFVANLKGAGKLVLEDPAECQLHAWPILYSFIARNVTEQISGIDQVASHIARMLVMKCIA